VSSGCSGFDGLLTVFYRRVDAAIRAADRSTLVWYEPNPLFNSGAASLVGPLGDRAGGFALTTTA
jgi:endoglycosylceramidase